MQERHTVVNAIDKPKLIDLFVIVYQIAKCHHFSLSVCNSGNRCKIPMNLRTSYIVLPMITCVSMTNTVKKYANLYLTW